MNSLDADESILFADAHVKEWLAEFMDEWIAPQMKMLARMVIGSLDEVQRKQLEKLNPEAYKTFMQSFGIPEGEPWLSTTDNQAALRYRQPLPQPPGLQQSLSQEQPQRLQPRSAGTAINALGASAISPGPGSRPPALRR
jgi:hypothetical protein